MVLLRRAARFSFGLLLPAVLALALSATAQSANCNSNDAGAPCFSGNPDILGGRKSLLRDDDLIVNTLQPSSTPTGANLFTSNSTITKTSQTSISFSTSTTLSNVITVQGRLFSLDHDQIVSAVATRAGGALLELEGSDANVISFPNLAVLNGAQFLYGISGDFLGNGFDQMVVAAVQSGNLTFQVMSAVDPTDTSQGLTAGSVTAPVPLGANNVVAITSGVFSDPQAEVPRPPAQIAVLSRSPTTNMGLVVTFYAVDSNLNVSPTGKSVALTLAAGTTTPSVIAIAAGRFSGGNHDQLAIAYPAVASIPIFGAITVITVDFDGQGNPTQRTSSGTGLSVILAITTTYPATVYLAKGKFNWFSLSDQLAISTGTNGGSGTAVGVMTFDSSLNGKMGTLYTASNACHFGLAAGRFDSMQANPNPPPEQVPDPNLQLADVGTNCSSNTSLTATIYDVDPNTFAVAVHSTKDITDVLGTANGPPTNQGAWLFLLLPQMSRGVLLR